MNILLTSVGRRAYMVKYFQKALKENGLVHVCNSDDMTVAFQYADKCVVSPLIFDKDYIPFLKKYCKENKIDILLSLFDMDLLMLAKHKSEFEKIGTKVIISNEDFVSICNDKWKTYEFLMNNGFNVPKTYLSVEDVKIAIDNGEIKYPIVVKPRFGCGSIGLTIADDVEALTFFSNQVEKKIRNSYLKYESATTEDVVIYQECLMGQEYGIDVINDLKGNFVNAIVKKKLAMRSGETDISETVLDDAIYQVGKNLSQCSRHIANLDVDVFMVDGIPYVLEMNARFGGGYPFSHVTGCDLPQAIVDWCSNKNVEIETLSAKPNIRVFKEIELKM